MESKQLAETIAAALDEKKGIDITIINIYEKSVIADYFVIVSATSTTAVRALSDNVEEKLSKAYGIEPRRRDGVNESKWVAMDYGSVIVHIFHHETREYYHLERLWMDDSNSYKYGT